VWIYGCPRNGRTCSYLIMLCRHCGRCVNIDSASDGEETPPEDTAHEQQQQQMKMKMRPVSDESSRRPQACQYHIGCSDVTVIYGHDTISVLYNDVVLCVVYW